MGCSRKLLSGAYRSKEQNVAGKLFLPILRSCIERILFPFQPPIQIPPRSELRHPQILFPKPASPFQYLHETPVAPRYSAPPKMEEQVMCCRLRPQGTWYQFCPRYVARRNKAQYYEILRRDSVRPYLQLTSVARFSLVRVNLMDLSFSPLLLMHMRYWRPLRSKSLHLCIFPTLFFQNV